MNEPRTIDLEALRGRAELLRKLRRFFDDRGFLEVQTPCLSRDCVVDAYADPIAVDSARFQIGQYDLADTFYLQPSPESAMKRLLAAGAPSIYSIGPVFRGGERGRLHNPEFTMLEWYEVDANFDGGVELLGSLAAEVLGTPTCDVVTYRQVFQDRLGIDPIDAATESLFELARGIEPQLADSMRHDHDSLLDFLLTTQIQPHLGDPRPLILTHYPISQAALSKPARDDPRCAARFELFAHGIELANGYDELLDADTLILRYRDHNRRRARAGLPPLPVETTLIRAMRRGLPPCTGVALGVDRLLMVQLGVHSIDEVMPLTIERA